MLDIHFFGVRGSTPCSGPAVARYGGSTSCVVVQVPGEAPMMCDMGTGARNYGLSAEIPSPFRATTLLTHVHWDHILGMPFFGPTLRPGAELEIIGPRQPEGEGSLRDALSRAVSPPLFPVGFDELKGDFSFREVWEDEFAVGSARVTAFPVRHIGATLGFRVEAGAGSVVYISDHQQPIDGSLTVPADLIEHCWQADLLIHDAQYSGDEFMERPDWGHCSVDFAVEVARAAEVKRLVLYHHDPAHDDDWIDDALAKARAQAGEAFEVIASYEGLHLQSGV